MTAKALLEKRAIIVEQIRELAALIDKESREFTAEEQPKWDSLNADADKLARQIAIAQRCESLDVESARLVTLAGRDDVDGDPARRAAAGATEEHRAAAMTAWFRRHSASRPRLTAGEREACDVVGLDPDCPELRIRLHSTDRLSRMTAAWRGGESVGREQRALSSVTASAGGVAMVPESMVNQLELNLLAYGGVLATSEIIRTTTRERLRWVTASDTANKGRRLGESAATAVLEPTLAGVYWDAYKYTSDEIRVPYELLTGTPFNLAAVVGAMMGERLGRKLADDLTTGTGVGQPKGIVTAATTKAAASATAIAWTDIEALVTAVDPAYRIGAAFMFHDSVRSLIKNLVDGFGRPLWLDGPNGTEPATLRGFPWYINQSMNSSAASGNETILFGQLSKYKVRQVNEVRMYQLSELRRQNDEDVFLAFLEADGNLLDAGTAPIKVLQH